jgi:DNA (cytosine-5)-methyltransferase 1
VPIYEDVRNVTRERLEADGIAGVSVITGGFPCQDISVAGKQAGIQGERSGLWSECARILGEFRPRYAIFENVTALLSGERGKWFERVLWDISEVGYDAEWHCIPASWIGAQHIRNRVWIIAYPNSDRLQGRDTERRKTNGKDGTPARRSARRAFIEGNNSDPERREQEFSGAIRRIRREKYSFQRDEYWKTTSEPFVRRGTHGIPNRMDRLKGLGNAVVPQIPEIIGRAIMEVENG